MEVTNSQAMFEMFRDICRGFVKQSLDPKHAAGRDSVPFSWEYSVRVNMADCNVFRRNGDAAVIITIPFMVQPDDYHTKMSYMTMEGFKTNITITRDVSDPDSFSPHLNHLHVLQSVSAPTTPHDAVEFNIGSKWQNGFDEYDQDFFEDRYPQFQSRYEQVRHHFSTRAGEMARMQSANPISARQMIKQPGQTITAAAGKIGHSTVSTVQAAARLGMRRRLGFFYGDMPVIGTILYTSPDEFQAAQEFPEDRIDAWVTLNYIVSCSVRFVPTTLAAPASY